MKKYIYNTSDGNIVDEVDVTAKLGGLNPDYSVIVGNHGSTPANISELTDAVDKTADCAVRRGEGLKGVSLDVQLAVCKQAELSKE